VPTLRTHSYVYGWKTGDDEMTQAIEKRQVDPKLSNLIRSFKGYEKGMAELLPKHLSVERMFKLAVAASMRNPRLLDCAPQTIINSLLQAAEMGIEPVGSLGEGYLIPRWNKRNNCFECNFQPGYQGLLRLVMQSGIVASVDADVIREGDKFEYKKGLQLIFEHRPNLLGPANAPVLAAYAIAYMKTDEARTIAMVSRAELDGIRSRADAGSKRDASQSPWETDYSEMAKKTALKRLCKLLPKRTQDPVWKALEADEDVEHDTGAADAMQLAEQAMQEAAQLPEYTQELPSKPTRLDRVRAQVAAKVATPQVSAAQTMQAEFEPDGRIVDTSDSQDFDLPEG
jgi:recombination protein RecT